MARQSAFRNAQFAREALPEADVNESDLHLSWLQTSEKTPRPRAWEKANRAATYRGVPPQLHARVKEVAGELEVIVDEVARVFLEYGLACYQRGDLRIEPVLNMKLTLFPKGQRRWYENPQTPTPPTRQKKKPKKQEHKPWRLPRVSYRLPASIRQQVDEIRQEKNVPVGEVVTLFLSHALEAYENGRLILQPIPRQGASLGSLWRPS
ncbi:MAG: hypothetical protein HUU38_28470 [Anaerolineales bacterium]|nr:hypothetical protein [Anaerolineales bacterium]